MEDAGLLDHEENKDKNFPQMRKSMGLPILPV